MMKTHILYVMLFRGCRHCDHLLKIECASFFTVVALSMLLNPFFEAAPHCLFWLWSGLGKYIILPGYRCRQS